MWVFLCLIKSFSYKNLMSHAPQLNCFGVAPSDLFWARMHDFSWFSSAPISVNLEPQYLQNLMMSGTLWVALWLFNSCSVANFLSQGEQLKGFSLHAPCYVESPFGHCPWSCIFNPSELANLTPQLEQLKSLSLCSLSVSISSISLKTPCVLLVSSISV